MSLSNVTPIIVEIDTKTINAETANWIFPIYGAGHWDASVHLASLLIVATFPVNCKIVIEAMGNQQTVGGPNYNVFQDWISINPRALVTTGGLQDGVYGNAPAKLLKDLGSNKYVLEISFVIPVFFHGLRVRLDNISGTTNCVIDYAQFVRLQKQPLWVIG